MLMMNVLPPPDLDAFFSDAIVNRFRLRPLTIEPADRGILFFCLQAKRRPRVRVRQDAVEGHLLRLAPEMDPLVGPNEGTRMFTVPP
jgi:hypothetical protein